MSEVTETSKKRTRYRLATLGDVRRQFRRLYRRIDNGRGMKNLDRAKALLAVLQALEHAYEFKQNTTKDRVLIRLAREKLKGQSHQQPQGH